MANTVTSPNTDNLFNGGGALWFKKEGETDYRHLGNAPTVQIGSEIEWREHRSSLTSRRPVDRRDIQEQSFTVTFELEEGTPDNFAMFLLGDVSNVGTTFTTEIGKVSAIKGALRWISNNEGPNFQLDFPFASIGPDGELDLVTEDWATIPLTAEILFDEPNGRFGTKTMVVGLPAAPVNVLPPALSSVTPEVGDVPAVVAHNGLWNNVPRSYTYQWQQDNAGDGTFVNIVGAVASNYVPVSGNIGNALRCGVTATNEGGSSAAVYTLPSALVLA